MDKPTIVFYYTYILFSLKTSTFYAGSTDNLERRFKEHQSGQVNSTKHKRPLVLIYYEAIPDHKRAQVRERYFKTSWGKRFLKKQLSCLNSPVDSGSSQSGTFNRTTLIAKLINCGALSASQVKNLFNNGAVFFGPVTGSP